jgi:hypothetical protein
MWQELKRRYILDLGEAPGLPWRPKTFKRTEDYRASQAIARKSPSKGVNLWHA